MAEHDVAGGEDGSKPTTVIVLSASIAFVCAALAVASAGDASLEALLDYRRSAIAAGSLYRLATAHFIHLSTAHALLDIAGLVLVAWIFAAELTARRMAIVTFAAIAAIDAALWLLHPEIERYAGLSGVLHGWFAAGAAGWALADRRSPAFVMKRAWGVALLCGLAVKLLLELRGHSFWLDGSMQVVTSAHRWGAAAGALCAVVDVLFRRRGAGASVAS